MDYFFPGQCYETVVTDRAADGMLYHARDHASLVSPYSLFVASAKCLVMALGRALSLFVMLAAIVGVSSLLVVDPFTSYYVHLNTILVKLPQIIKMINARSAENISYLATIQELAAITFTITYNFAKSFPFRYVLLLKINIINYACVQCLGRECLHGDTSADCSHFNVLLQSQPGLSGSVCTSVQCGSLVPHVEICFARPSLYTSRQCDSTSYQQYGKISASCTLTLYTLCPQLMQIFTTYSNKTTGQLSIITYSLSWFFMIIRIFTNLLETADTLMMIILVSLFVGNSIVLFQFYLYNDSPKTKKTQLSSRLSPKLQ